MITLKTLRNATKQQVFDQVTTHLLTQKKKSRFSDGTCAYRSTRNGDSLKCAAGCLISDEEFASLKLKRYNSEQWTFLVAEKIAPKKHSNLINALQEVHDDTDVKEWYEYLGDVAREFKLNQKVLRTIKNS